MKTGSLTVEIKKGTFNKYYSQVALVAEGVGGFVSDSRSDSSGGRITGDTVTVRIPNESFSKVMAELEKIGKVKSIGEGAQDVTEEYVDLESRINNLRAQEAVYLRLMAKARPSRRVLRCSANSRSSRSRSSSSLGARTIWTTT